VEQKKALIALSGGVDSSVAAYLTGQAGFICIGGTARMCDRALLLDRYSEDYLSDARHIAEHLGMEFHIFDAADAFKNAVVTDFITCYEKGLTPNPCIRCNQTIKFSYLLDKALELGCDCIVTGHYAKIRQDSATGRYLLYKAADEAKDQSYFLAGLNQHQLRYARFPLGEFTKEQIRQIAESLGFLNAKKRDSQDICFIPDGDYKAFLCRFTGKDYPCGDYLDLSGKVVGRHRGAVCYTRGQRKGLGLALGAPVYVCKKDMHANTVTVGPNEALFATTLLADDWNWFPFEALTEPIRVFAKARYNQPPQPATVYPAENGTAKVVFDQPQRALTPGQAVVLYDGDLVVGGGTITEVIKKGEA